MKARILVSMSGVALFVVLAVPIWLAAQEQRRSSEPAASPDMDTANPVPLINQPLVPDAVAPGGAGFTLTVNGTGFVAGSVVDWNGGGRATTFVSESQLTAVILASDIATAITASVTVVSPSPGGGTSNVVFLPITGPTASLSFSRSDYSESLFGPDSIGAGDFNGDGRLSLAVANQVDVSVFIGNGDGTFQPYVAYATDAYPDSMVVADFNGDGKLDLAVRSQYSFTISVLLGEGDGTFHAYVLSPTKSCNGRLATGDFNSDGKLDLACTSSSNNNVAILLGNGDGTFQSEVDDAAGSGASSVAVGDFNGDGKLDLAVDDPNATEVSILLGNGDGTFQAPVGYATAGQPSDSVDVADLNGDGLLDLVVPNQNDTVSVLLGKGDGTFRSHVDYPAGTDVGRSAIADINGDGNLDLIVTPRDSSDVLSILLGKGDGTFGPAATYSTGSSPLGVVAGDFNNDGRLDLATANNGSSSVSVLLQSTTVALSKASLKFGDQLIGTTSPAQTVTLTNTGAITLTISSIVASGDFLQANNCGSSVQPGASCTIDVSFKPTAKGTRTGTLTITDNAADSPQTVGLTGVGTVVELSPATLNFGPEEVGTTTEPRSVTVTNTSNAALSISGIGVRGDDFGDFSEVSTCSSSLPAGASCTVKVRFSPKAKGQRQASLGITDNGGGGSQEVRLAGFGL